MLYIHLIVLAFTCSDIVVKNTSLKVNQLSSYKWNACMLLYLFLQIFGRSTFDTTIIDVSQGGVVGIFDAKYNYKMYLGIPYADIPERFKAPKPPKRWDTIYEARTSGNICSQIKITNHFGGSENCLFLNVYTPKYSLKGFKIPVMVFIHGGGFRFGCGNLNLLDPVFLVRHDVIVVDFNYRLGPQGFLCLGIDEAPGNAGLKDQLAALKWIRKNIGAFGGDEENVTLFGESAGAASVAFHLISPKSKGLFKRAILQSGSVLAPWTFTYNPIEKAAECVNDPAINKTNPKELFKFYKSASEKELALLSGETLLDLTKFRFKPCLEKNINDKESFLTESVFSNLKSGNFAKVPLIIGFNNAEGLLFMKTNPYKLLEPSFSSMNLNTGSDIEKIMDKARIFYDFEASEDGIIDYHSDVLFNIPLLFFTRKVLSKSNNTVFNYYFRYGGYRNFAKFTAKPWFRGAAHADELFYMFQIKRLFWHPNAEDQLIIDRMTGMWTNFAKFGNPTPSAAKYKSRMPIDWHPSNRTHLQFLEIDKEVKMIDIPIRERMNFWDKIIDEYGFKT